MRVLPIYPEITHTDPSGQTRKDFESSQDPRWCPGCGDYSILAQLQRVLPALQIPKENYVFVSGIGCASRFPYYMDTYGLHSIHGRAPAIATGIKSARPDLSVWVVAGDGDALSIGAGQLLHAIRRNIDVKILLFNNRIYGLTKGQYSPTSPVGLKTKSTPMGSIDHPLDPVSVVLGAGATFVARTVDVNAKHMQEVLRRAALHKGTAFVEILQNCPIFNDAAFDYVSDKDKRPEFELAIEHGKPLRFGKGSATGERAITLGDGMEPKVLPADEAATRTPLLHDEQSELSALLLSRLRHPEFPTPIGVFRAVERATYNDLLNQQVAEAQGDAARRARGGSLQDLLNQGQWTVQ